MKIREGLDSILGPGRFEIIVVQNGSTDKTPDLLNNLKDHAIQVIHLPEKGLGLALRAGVQQARYDYFGFLGLDLPFLFSDVTAALEIWSEYDVVFGSKAHPASQLEIVWKRRIASFIFRRLNRFFFNIKICDTQGTIFMKRSRIMPFLHLCDSNNAFFTAQLAIYAQAFKLKMTEVPVTMVSENKKRRSKYNIVRDGSKMFKAMVREFFRFQKRVNHQKKMNGLEN
jgi:glycosyltransferase involved in cell wall biosynthesis